MQERKIGKNDAGQRLDKFLVKAFPAMPASLLYKLIRKKKIKVNRSRAEQGQILVEGDVLQLFVAPELLAVEQSLGRILAVPTVGCPPAVPILVCGERIDRHAINCFKYYGIDSCLVIKEE